MTEPTLFDLPPEPGRAPTEASGPPVLTEPDRVPTEAPGPRALAEAPGLAGGAKRRVHRAFVEALERWLQARQVPYVAVDEPKRAALRDARLQPFDFILYATEGDNWLVLIGRRTVARRTAMRGWEEVFGAGFRAVFAVPRGDWFTFRDLDGRTVSIAELGD